MIHRIEEKVKREQVLSDYLERIIKVLKV